jgi:hypothetical protein
MSVSGERLDPHIFIARFRRCCHIGTQSDPSEIDNLMITPSKAGSIP